MEIYTNKDQRILLIYWVIAIVELNGKDTFLYDRSNEISSEVKVGWFRTSEIWVGWFRISEIKCAWFRIISDTWTDFGWLRISEIKFAWFRIISDIRNQWINKGFSDPFDLEIIITKEIQLLEFFKLYFVSLVILQFKQTFILFQKHRDFVQLKIVPDV